MSTTTVAELKAALGVGSLYSDATIQEVCDAADDALLPFLWKNENYNVAHSNTTTEGTLYFDELVTGTYYVGQSVVVTKNGSPFNGTKTITGVGEYSITYAVTGSPTASEYHPVVPYGIVSGVTQNTYATIPAVREASLMISIDIWQSRQAPSSGGVTVDGYAPSPYRMGNTLLARVRGLLAPYLDPRSMVG
jgi:hypothetical protein